MDSTNDCQLAISVNEAAKRLAISRFSVLQLVHRGSVPSIRVGRRIILPVGCLQKWLEGDPKP